MPLAYNVNATIHTEAPATISTFVVRCPKCGTNKASGKISCCARGGAWFKKCGDADDTEFDHTWAEGTQACESKFWRVYLFCTFRRISGYQACFVSTVNILRMEICVYVCTAIAEATSLVGPAAPSPKATVTIPNAEMMAITITGML